MGVGPSGTSWEIYHAGLLVPLVGEGGSVAGVLICTS